MSSVSIRSTLRRSSPVRLPAEEVIAFTPVQGRRVARTRATCHHDPDAPPHTMGSAIVASCKR
ncbi:hypothetical protein KCP75_02285 [Salmonella enterica subsp. enterica]|nr:hypothetical protein KCP75_02285 [Salmonella enterica subsp. enterica]